jgi:hypothetical protein
VLVQVELVQNQQLLEHLLPRGSQVQVRLSIISGRPPREQLRLGSVRPEKWSTAHLEDVQDHITRGRGQLTVLEDGQPVHILVAQAFAVLAGAE